MDINTKIFQKINGIFGKNRWLDAFGRAGAEWVIIAMAGWYIAVAYVAEMPDKKAFFMVIGCAAGTILVGWCLDMVLGYFARETRPYAALPADHSMFHAIFNWKSFPSDHTMVAFVIFFCALIFGLPLAWPLLVLALWVAWGRVFAGVHYPIDILGGLATAVLLSLILKALIPLF